MVWTSGEERMSFSDSAAESSVVSSTCGVGTKEGAASTRTGGWMTIGGNEEDVDGFSDSVSIVDCTPDS